MNRIDKSVCYEGNRGEPAEGMSIPVPDYLSISRICQRSKMPAGSGKYIRGESWWETCFERDEDCICMTCRLSHEPSFPIIFLERRTATILPLSKFLNMSSRPEIIVVPGKWSLLHHPLIIIRLSDVTSEKAAMMSSEKTGKGRRASYSVQSRGVIQARDSFILLLILFALCSCRRAKLREYKTTGWLSE